MTAVCVTDSQLFFLLLRRSVCEIFLHFPWPSSPSKLTSRRGVVSFTRLQSPPDERLCLHWTANYFSPVYASVWASWCAGTPLWVCHTFYSPMHSDSTMHSFSPMSFCCAPLLLSVLNKSSSISSPSTLGVNSSTSMGFLTPEGNN